jgi:RNA recognition motif-containing protein
MMKDKTTSKHPKLTFKEKFRGFAFVTYKNEEDGKAVLEKNPKFKGKRLQISRAVTKGQSRKKVEEEKNRKLFIAGLSKELTRGKENEVMG